MKFYYLLLVIILLIAFNCQYFTLADKEDWEKSSNKVASEVYIAGIIDFDGSGTNNYDTACYWVDGNLADINALSNGSPGGAYDIAVYKTDIYVAGFYNDEENGGNMRACYWKNGELHDILGSAARGYTDSEW